MVKKILPLLMLILLVSCTSTEDVPREPTVVPFPTVTPGVAISGAVSPFSASNLVNPATVVAVANQPTATPDLLVCPQQTGEVTLRAAPETNAEIIAEIIRFLSAGGTPVALEDALRDQWQILGEEGFVRADVDLTGEGLPEIIAGYTAPDEGGVLLIAGCVNRRYETLYTTISDTFDPPALIFLNDMNFNRLPDVLFTTRRCDVTIGDTCSLLTTLVGWQSSEFRFVSLIGVEILSENPPQVVDLDNDSVEEIAVRMDNNGDEVTGPLRTGTNFYDWNGSEYVLSRITLDVPEFRIQVVHEADRNVLTGDYATAIALYQEALTDDALRSWFADNLPIEESYVRFRLLTAQAAIEAPADQVLAVYQSIAEAFPEPEQNTPFIEMAQIFFDTFTVTADIGAACAEVVNYALGNPLALELINRYGTRNPTYSAGQLCPMVSS